MSHPQKNTKQPQDINGSGHGGDGKALDRNMYARP